MVHRVFLYPSQGEKMDIPKKKFGFLTAVGMVVGIVIGSGVFKSAGDVLNASGGSLPIAILAWLIGGFIIVISSYAFSLVALKNTKASGLIDYIENLFGPKLAYLVGWYLNFVYYPVLVGILSWLAGDVTNSLLGTSSLTWPLAIFYFIGVYTLNLLSPIIAGKTQVSATIIKVIPLALIAVVGLLVGLFNGNTLTELTKNATNVVNTSAAGLAAAVAVTAFAYDGWILALSITQELKDAKKTLSKALVTGSLFIVAIYLLFFLGLSGVISNNEAVANAGSLDTSILAAERLFGVFFGNLVSVMILISVLGTLNGLTMGAVRGMYQISVRNVGPKPELFTHLTKNDAPIYGGLLSLLVASLWGLLWYGNFQGWWNGFMDTSILSIIFLYLAYILVYIDIFKTFNELSFIKRYIVPTLATISALYLIYGAFTSDPRMFGFFLIIVMVILGVGYFFYKKGKNPLKD
jgi:APA family basic amino acid/polyamine antiporter